MILTNILESQHFNSCLTAVLAGQLSPMANDPTLTQCIQLKLSTLLKFMTKIKIIGLKTLQQLIDSCYKLFYQLLESCSNLD